MATKKNNHYVPKWLLRRFTRRDKGDRDQIWMFRTGAGAIPTNIRNAGSCNYFYGDPDNGLENLLESYDNRDASVLQRIEEGVDLGTINADICRMVRLLSLRTRSLRNKYIDSTKSLVIALRDAADDPESLPAMRRYLESIFDEEFEKTWQKVPEALRCLVSKEALKRQAHGSLHTLDLAPEIKRLANELYAAVPWDESAERGQVEGLIKLLTAAESEPIPSGWLRLEWQVVNMPDRSLILGDGTAFAMRQGHRSPIDVSAAGKEPHCLCLPIAPEALLLGKLPELEFQVDMEFANAASAAHSFEAYFAADASEQASKYSRLIGSITGVLTSAEIDDIGSRSWKNLERD